MSRTVVRSQSEEKKMTALTGWENFYVIVGSSAGALIGLQFIAITLIADMPAVRGQDQAGAAFATPTIIHFSVVLFLSAILSAPWHDVANVALVLLLAGITGIIYQIIVVRRMRTQGVYNPEFEDWLFHALLPFVAYVVLAGSAFAARSDVDRGLFGVAAAALLLLFIGVHNTWDAVIYHVFTQRLRRAKEEEQK
jgi:hypothetical protein